MDTCFQASLFLRKLQCGVLRDCAERFTNLCESTRPVSGLPHSFYGNCNAKFPKIGQKRSTNLCGLSCRTALRVLSAVNCPPRTSCEFSREITPRGAFAVCQTNIFSFHRGQGFHHPCDATELSFFPL